MFPRAVVRERNLAGENSSWYVYRDGHWSPSGDGAWWQRPGLPRLVVSDDGWIREATSTAADLLGISPAEVASHHFTDFIIPGTLEESESLFRIIGQGHVLDATVLLRPTSGDVIAVQLHAAREGDGIVDVFQLADEIDLPVAPTPVGRPQRVRCIPARDVAFRGYVDRALARMPEATPEGLALRLRRLYPHASVSVSGTEWVAARDQHGDGVGDRWWATPDLPTVRYDREALILDANAAAEKLFGRRMIGHHWQEFVTPGSTEQVTIMLEILREVGAAESRFRMPRSDGTLVEFDSYTEVRDEEYTTVIREVPGSVGTDAQP